MRVLNSHNFSVSSFFFLGGGGGDGTVSGTEWALSHRRLIARHMIVLHTLCLEMRICE